MMNIDYMMACGVMWIEELAVKTAGWNSSNYDKNFQGGNSL
jgi:hypothetical protein